MLGASDARSLNLGQSEGLSEWGNEGGAGSETLTLVGWWVADPTHTLVCKDGNSPHHSSPQSLFPSLRNL